MPYQSDRQNSPVTEPAPVPEYRGKTIDQIFPIIHESKSSSEIGDPKRTSFNEAGYEIKIFGSAPVSIAKDGRAVLDLRTKAPKGDYWSLSVGRSKLLGPRSDQLYVVSTGPGAVCCTNYWIAEISTGSPRLIFRSEEFGEFRDAMEIFDVDNDGVYELVRFDSCMRYFLGDCGSCSPEPRAYFKYDAKLRTYRPAKRILQDFVREQFADRENQMANKFREIRETDDIGAKVDLRRLVIDHVADLIHIGDERKAWKIFETYGEVVGVEDRLEIRKRLAQCKYYQALRRTN